MAHIQSTIRNLNYYLLLLTGAHSADVKRGISQILGGIFLLVLPQFCALPFGDDSNAVFKQFKIGYHNQCYIASGGRIIISKPE